MHVPRTCPESLDQLLKQCLTTGCPSPAAHAGALASRPLLSAASSLRAYDVTNIKYRVTIVAHNGNQGYRIRLVMDEQLGCCL